MTGYVLIVDDNDDAREINALISTSTHPRKHA
jgi:hypothetical protein